MEPPGEGGDMAAALRAAKRALREELRQRLRALGAAEKQRQSRLLSRKVISHPKYQESKRIAIFLSMPDEIQTEEIIKDIFKEGKECFIPRYKPHSNHMDMLKLSSAEDISSLTLTSWNILQPSDDDSAREEALAGDNLTCKLPRMFQSKQPDLYLNPENMSRAVGNNDPSTPVEHCRFTPAEHPA
ncbi:5-formyltetrahydrofolate cyclo-ligase isoform X3 [Aquila chrysaetos chrysaetos]|uniref:5-formyltetrahydrofolate cyclo-ligase isoform X3 n=1 Tax=Aquila chrysaetos chrysaetos TaxID=223781 RepID=UPI001177114D|nr:5-formyltetrahydrofolate cyclo-ligase isoform X3 [Aquila chrysaetos chrysaetos]